MNQYGRDQRDYIKFRESDSRDDKKPGRFKGINRFGEDFPHHDIDRDDQYSSNYGLNYEDINSIKHYESSKEDHTGKGPRGYKRSAEKIQDEACEILMKDFALDASDIEVDVLDDVLYLRGTVASRSDKKRAEFLLDRVAGIRDIQNQLTVRFDQADGWIPGIGNISETGGSHGEI